MHRDGIVHCCHVTCLQLLRPQTPDQVIAITRTAFENDICLENRETWLRSSLAATLSLAIGIPVELRAQIAYHLTREYAATLLRSIKTGQSSSMIDIFTPIEKQFCYFEGRRYLSGARNALGGEDTPTPSHILIAEDAYGVVDLLLCGETLPTIEAAPGIWWKVLEAGKPGRITLHTDVGLDPNFLLSSVGSLMRCRASRFAG